MGRLVQGPSPRLDQASLRFRQRHLDARAHPPVNRERESLEHIGYDVYTENQNLFRLRGASATIADKPDPIGEKHREFLISDANTGRPSPSHQAQVRIYQYSVPRALLQFEGKDALGQVRYPNSCVGSPASAVTPEFIANMGALIRRLAADTSARRVPSATECRFCDIGCRFCDIGKVDCLVRIDADPALLRERMQDLSAQAEAAAHRLLGDSHPDDG